MSQNSAIIAFGQRLREERLRTGRSQVEFAEWGGASENSQTAYEKGRTPPTVAYLLRLGEQGVDIGYVLTGRRSAESSGLESQVSDMFGQLSTREKGAVFSLLSELTGNVLDIGASRQSFTAAMHEKQREYRGNDDERG